MPTNEVRPIGPREVWLSFGGLFLLWALAKFPIWFEPFWFSDDYNMWDGFGVAGLFNGGARLGRPLNGPLYWMYLLVPPPDHSGAWVLRLIQGLLHSGASAVILLRLIPLTGRIGAWLAVLLFHLWAFNNEATVWYAASTYPLAALLSLGGVALVVRDWATRRGYWLGSIGGILLLALSPLSNQAPALIGGCFWLILSALRTVPPDRSLTLRKWLIEAVMIAGGYILGVALSLLFMKLFGGNRAEGVVDLATKWAQWKLFLTRLWWFPEVYPLALQIARTGLLGLAVAALLWALVKRRMKTAPAVALVGCGLLLCVAPFAANLAVAESWSPVRVLYGGPLIWVFLAAFLFLLGRQVPLLSWITAGLLISISLWDLRLGLREVQEYASIYERDRETLRRLETFAAEHGAHEVLFMDWVHSSPWQRNPYELELFYQPGIKHSVFQNDSSNYRFLKFYSESLEITPWWPYNPPEPHRWERLRRKYEPLARSLPHDEWLLFRYLPEEHLVLVIPR
jgi:hypothetical protein